jgi:hypothetical protein
MTRGMNPRNDRKRQSRGFPPMKEVIRSDFEKRDPGKSIALLDEESDQRGGHNPILIPIG